MSRKAASPSPPRMWTSECLFSRTAVMMEERRWEGRRKRWRNERCGIKKGMRVVEASKEEQWKGGGGGGGRGGWGSDTALCVAMVQAQSELHSSFAAQLANYPQTAVLIRSSQSLLDFQEVFFCFCFLISALTHEHESRNNLCIYMLKNASKMYTPTENAIPNECAVAMWRTALLNVVVVLCCVSRATCVI